MNNADKILCFRVFDLRDRFEMPYATFDQALAALQSDSAYMPEESGEIKCYLKTGEAISIPEHFFIGSQRRFANRDEAVAWVMNRDKEIKEGRAWRAMFGMLIADPSAPVAEQIEQAMDANYPHLIEADQNPIVCEKVASWLDAAIDALNPRQKRYSLEELLAQCDPYMAHADELCTLLPHEIDAVANPSDSTTTHEITTVCWMIARQIDNETTYYDISGDCWLVDPLKASRIKSDDVANLLLSIVAPENGRLVPDAPEV